jgi:hypothetical protein
MTEYESVQPAYETAPKETPTGKGLPSDGKQFPGNKMPQMNRTQKKMKSHSGHVNAGRHSEYSR